MATAQLTADRFKAVFGLAEDFVAMGDKQNPRKTAGIKGRQKGFADPGGSDDQALVELFAAEVLKRQGFDLGPDRLRKGDQWGRVGANRATIKAA